MEINFTFEHAPYTAPMSFYDVNRCRLPDGRIIAADGWAERRPPIPVGLKVVKDDGSDVPVATFRGVL